MDYNEQGIQALQNRDYEQAIAAFIKAAEAAPEEPLGYINLGNVFGAVGDVEKAERFFQKAISLDPTAGTAFYGLANLYYNKERYEEAAKLYEQAIRLQVQQADVYFMLAKSLERSMKDKLALPYMQRAAELAQSDPEIILSYGILLAKLELFTEAEQVLLQAVSLDQESADAHYNLGLVYAVATNQKTKALAHLKQAFTLEPKHTQANEIYQMILQNTNS